MDLVGIQVVTSEIRQAIYFPSDIHCRCLWFGFKDLKDDCGSFERRKTLQVHVLITKMEAKIWATNFIIKVF